MRSGWETLTLGDLAQINPESLGTRTAENHEFRYIDLSMVDEGTITYPGSKIKFKDASPRARRIVKKGDILMSTVRPNLRGFAKVEVDAGDLICSTGFAVLRCKEDSTAEYLNQYILSDFIYSQIDTLVVGSNYPAINNDDVKNLEVRIPTSLIERQKVAAILRTWDEAIERTSQLLAKKKQSFKSIRYHFIEKPQADAAVGEWKSLRYGDITQELSLRNGGRLGEDKIMGVFKGEGLIPMRAHLIASDIARYKILPPRAFAYNPMRINVGSIAFSSFEDDVLVSPDYVAFSAQENIADPHYIRLLIGTKKWEDHLKMVGSGGVRIRIYYENLAEMQLRIPSLKEQQRIVKILTAIEQDINLTAKMLARFQSQKRGLMQKLLTGAWRITPSKEAAA